MIKSNIFSVAFFACMILFALGGYCAGFQQGEDSAMYELLDHPHEFGEKVYERHPHECVRALERAKSRHAMRSYEIE